MYNGRNEQLPQTQTNPLYCIADSDCSIHPTLHAPKDIRLEHPQFVEIMIRYMKGCG